jgi:hypothetical protein
MCTQESDVDADRRGIHVAVILVTGFILGIGGGVLSWLGGFSVPLAVLTGFGAFGGACLFILAVLRYVRSGA